MISGSVRTERNEHSIVLNEHHLKRVLRGYFDYYHRDRVHLGIEKESPAGRQTKDRLQYLTD
jgi:putative transposase